MSDATRQYQPGPRSMLIGEAFEAWEEDYQYCKQHENLSKLNEGRSAKIKEARMRFSARCKKVQAKIQDVKAGGPFDDRNQQLAYDESQIAAMDLTKIVLLMCSLEEFQEAYSRMENFFENVEAAQKCYREEARWEHGDEGELFSRRSRRSNSSQGSESSIISSATQGAEGRSSANSFEERSCIASDR